MTWHKIHLTKESFLMKIWNGFMPVSYKILRQWEYALKKNYSSFFSGFLKVSTRTISEIPLMSSNAS